MKYISVEKFMKDINDGISINLLMKLKGLISTEIKIDKAKVYLNENEIVFKSLEDNNVYVELNIHQIVRIRNINKDRYSIDFDELQEIEIRIL